MRSEGALQPDAELVARLRAGDEDTFARVVRAWSPGMLHLARRHVADDATAVDAVQETWLAVLNGLGQFEGRSALRTWAFRILVNTAIRMGTRARRVVPIGSLSDEDGFGPTVDPSHFQGAGDPYPGHWTALPRPWAAPELASLDGELRAELSAALDALPERQRLVVMLRDVQGYASDEVCEILEVTSANQRVLLHRGRAAVRRRLAAYVERATSTGVQT